MKNRTVSDVMTKIVVTVDDSAGFKEMVRLMEESAVSALPVVDADGRLVGIVSEADLLLKEERAVEPRHRRLFGRRRRRMERAKAEGLVAAQVMTSPVVTVDPDASLGQAARRMHEIRVKRLPVVDEQGKVVGIVSRADLLSVFMRDDEEIRRDVVDGVLGRALSIGPDRVRATVREGVVTLEGLVEDRSLIPLLTEETGVGVRHDRVEHRRRQLSAGGSRSPHLEEVAVPTLIVHVADDRLARYDTTPPAAERIPGARLVTIDRGGHLLLGAEGGYARRLPASSDRMHRPVSDWWFQGDKRRRKVITGPTGGSV